LLDLEATDDDNDITLDDPDTTKPPISVHAITDVHTSNTMLVHLRLGDVNVHPLIDSCSIHNLIAKEVASCTGLPMVFYSPASITMANGKRTSCTGVYRQAPFSIVGDQFSAYFFMLPLPGYDMVLGTE
jgi:hypothetical protein